jgi:ABC-type uncharacterized transport system permease subunit
MNKKIATSIKVGIFSACIGSTMSFFINYALVPMPVSELSNAIHNGISGFMSGFMGGFIGLLLYFRISGSNK